MTVSSRAVFTVVGASFRNLHYHINREDRKPTHYIIMEEEEDLEELGEQLYNKIYPRNKNMAGKLTGMLLELPSSVLAQMLQDEVMLTKAVEKALSALHPFQHTSSKLEFQGEDEVSASSDSLGEQLYELVDIHNTGFTEKITGMLLEQKKEDVQKLLSDPHLLGEKVNVALRVLEEQNSLEADVSDLDPDDVDRLGDKLFGIVQQIDAKNCAGITGMLLEMDTRTLLQLFSDRSMLETAVQRAQAAIVTGSSPNM